MDHLLACVGMFTKKYSTGVAFERKIYTNEMHFFYYHYESLYILK